MLYRRTPFLSFGLNDEEWALLDPLLPKSRKSEWVDDRKIMNAIFCVLRTSMQWRDLPARSYTKAYNRFYQWSCQVSGNAFFKG
jgi:transposase